MGQISEQYVCKYLNILKIWTYILDISAEMQKMAEMADISVLCYYFQGGANFVYYAQIGTVSTELSGLCF